MFERKETCILAFYELKKSSVERDALLFKMRRICENGSAANCIKEM
jgi:hypothetical protein